MINRQAILEWSKDHPWQSKSFVEQDLIICRAIVEIFSDPFLAQELAWRGGTALHKLYLQPQARYSEDIDLVQIHPGPIKPIVERDDVLRCWQKYMALKGGEVPTQEDIIANMDAKLIDPDYLNDMQGILRPGVEFDPKTAYARVHKAFLDTPFPEN